MPKELDIVIYDFAAYIAKLCAMKSFTVNVNCKYKVYHGQ